MKIKKKKKKKQESVLQKIYDSLSKPFTVADGRNTIKLKNFIVEQKGKME